MCHTSAASSLENKEKVKITWCLLFESFHQLLYTFLMKNLLASGSQHLPTLMISWARPVWSTPFILSQEQCYTRNWLNLGVITAHTAYSLTTGPYTINRPNASFTMIMAQYFIKAYTMPVHEPSCPVKIRILSG